MVKKIYPTAIGRERKLKLELESTRASKPRASNVNNAIEQAAFFKNLDDNRRLNESEKRKLDTLNKQKLELETKKIERLTIEKQLNTNTQSSNYSPSIWTIMGSGNVNIKLICQHCSEKGFVHVKTSKKKLGVSGGKATAALLTAGLSLFAVGLSRKQEVTEAYCGNCESRWYF